jgi:hypothetical protein
MDAKILVGVTKGGLLVPVNLWKYRGGWCGVVLWRFLTMAWCWWQQLQAHRVEEST